MRLARLLLEIVVAGEMVTIVVYTYYHSSTLPQRIPAHFGPNGLPNRWGNHSSIYIGPAICLLFVLLFSTITYPIVTTRYRSVKKDIFLSLLAIFKGLIVLAMLVEQISFITRLSQYK